MKNKIILASNNQGKIKEFKAIFANYNIQLLTLKELNIIDEPEETGLTFIENALIKARSASKLSGYPALADDSGLVVNVLNGAPGIYSARFSSKGDDFNNNYFLLEKMKNIPDKERQAHFKCVLALLRHDLDPVPIIAQGEAYGEILHEARGSGGFGYDPLFLIPSLKQTFAEISPHDKNLISHRAKAVKQLIELFELQKETFFNLK